MNPTSVPSLDELATDPTRAKDLPADVVRVLTWKCLTVLTTLQVATTSASGRSAVNRSTSPKAGD